MQIGSDQPLCKALVYLIQQNDPTEPTRKCLQLLHQLVTNLLTDPSNVKFRLLATTNPTIQNKVLSFEGAHLFIQLLGFQYLGDSYEIVLEEMANPLQYLNYAQYILKQEIDSFQIFEPLDPAVNKHVNKAKQEHEEQKKYVEKLLRDFQSTRQEVYDEKIEETRRMARKQNSGKQ